MSTPSSQVEIAQEHLIEHHAHGMNIVGRVRDFPLRCWGDAYIGVFAQRTSDGVVQLMPEAVAIRVPQAPGGPGCR